MLEQIAYEIPRISESRQQIYQVADLEELSASALYTGSLPKMGPGGFGFISRDSYGSVPPIYESKGAIGKLTIRDFPTMQLHIHEIDGLITGANIGGKGKEGEKFSLGLSNYEAAMGDLYADNLGIKIRKIKEYYDKKWNRKP